MFFPFPMDNIESSASLVPLYGLKILTQNCDSLNLSTFKNDGSVKTFNRKIEAILACNADIVLLCDIRSKNQDKIIEHYVQCTATGGYKLITNSSISKRGVAIMYKNDLDLLVQMCISRIVIIFY